VVLSGRKRLGFRGLPHRSSRAVSPNEKTNKNTAEAGKRKKISIRPGQREIAVYRGGEKKGWWASRSNLKKKKQLYMRKEKPHQAGER